MKKTLATIFSTLFILFSLAGCGAHNQVNYESYEGHPRIVTLQIVGFNDFHGNTLDSETGLGISKTASVINEVTNNKLNTIILSQGDMWQGSAESNLTKGFIVTDWMSEQGFVSMTLGNHEFDWGEERIRENAAIANFPFLGINVYNRSTNERPDYCQPSVIVQKNGVKVGMMGPLAGVGDPVFWFTARPILGALGASMALSGSIVGPILFFVLWNIIRFAFLWYTQEFGYKVGTEITKDLSGGLLGKITSGASILGMFIIGALVQRWVSISFTPVVSKVTQQAGAYIDWAKLPSGTAGIKQALTQYASLGATGLDKVKVTTLQGNLDQLIPGLAALLLTLLCCKLLKNKVSPIVIILALFAVGIIGRVLGFM